MKKYLAVLVILLLAFFVAWPAWSIYQIQSAIQAKDADALARKIDFPSVRASLRSAAAQKIAELYVPPASAPSSPALLERMKQDTVARVVDATLETLVAPDTLIGLVSEGGQLKDSVERALRDQIGRGGSPARTVPGASAKKGGPVRTVSSAEEAPAREVGLQNIKGFAIDGPFRYVLGVAKYASASQADATVDLSYTGLDWKITAVRPRL
jgi:Protein of unknown function (DUF2939)